MSDISFGIRLTADGSGFVGNVRVAREELERLTNAAGKGADPVQRMGDSMGVASTKAVALGAAIGTFAVDAVRALANAATAGLRAADAIEGLSQSSGASVERISRLANVAFVGGTSFEQFERAVLRVAANLNGVDEESNKAQRAMAALGVTTKDPAQALEQLAKRLNEYADGAGKVEAVNAIFGREGAKMIPLLNDLATKTDVLGTTTAEQVAQAKRLGEEWRRLQIEGGALRDSILGAIVPAVADLLESFREGIRLAGDFWGAMSLFSSAGWFEKPRDGITKYTADIEKLKEANDDLMAQGEKYAAREIEINNNAIAQIQKKIEYLKFLERQEANRLIAANNADQNDRIAGRKPGLNIDLGKDGKAKKEVDDYRKAIEDVGKALAAAELEQQEFFRTDKITKAEKALAALMESDRWKKYTAEQKSAIEANYAYVASVEKQTDSMEEAARSAARMAAERAREQEQWERAVRDVAQATDELVDRLNFEARSIGLTNEQRERQIALKELDKARSEGLIKTEEEYLAMVSRINEAFNNRDAAAAMANAMQAQKDAWIAAYNEIASTITDAMTSAFFDMQNAAKYLRSALTQIFGNFVVRPIIAAVVSPLAGGITNAVAGSINGGNGGGLLGSIFGGTGGGGGGLNVLSSLSGLGNLAGGGIFGAGGALNSFATGGIGQALGLSSAGLDAAGGVALTGLGSTLGAVLPMIGVAVALAGALGAFKKGGGPKTGGFASIGDIAGIGRTDSTGRWFTPNQKDSDVQSIVNATSQSYTKLVSALGGSGSAGFALGFDTDPQGSAPNRLHAGAFVNGRQVYDAALGDLGKDEAALQERLTLESKRALLAALQASDLPAAVAGALNGLLAESATEAQIDDVLKLGGAMKTLMDALDGDVVAAATERWDQAGRSLTEVLRDQGANVEKLAAEYDGTAASAEALASATMAYREATVQALIGIKQLQKELSALFADSREQIELAGLSDDEKYSFYQQRAADLFTKIGQTDDPALVAEYASKINEYMLAAFGVLSPDEQLSSKQLFLESLNELDRLTNDRLSSIAQAIADDTANPFAAVQGVLDGAAAVMQDAAGTQSAAAGAMQQAAATIAAAADRLANITIKVDASGYELVNG
jgi:hypothetical protein